jgi:DNA-binding MarR family transcriptional regulator
MRLDKSDRTPAKAQGTREDERRSSRALEMNAFEPAMIMALAQKISSSASALYRPRFGVGMTEWRILALLAAEPWIAPVRIAEATGLDKAAVSRSLRELQHKGLAETRESGALRRRRPFALTRQGLAVHDELVEIARERQSRLLRAFSNDERVALAEYLGRLLRAVDEL